MRLERAINYEEKKSCPSYDISIEIIAVLRDLGVDIITALYSHICKTVCRDTHAWESWVVVIECILWEDFWGLGEDGGGGGEKQLCALWYSL